MIDPPSFYIEWYRTFLLPPTVKVLIADDEEADGGPPPAALHKFKSFEQRYPCYVVKPPQKGADMSLYNFYWTQHTAYRNKHSGMSNYRRSKLDVIPGFLQLMADTPHKRKAPEKRKIDDNEQCNEMFQELRAFSTKYRHCRVIKKENLKLYNWIIRQRVARKMKILAKDRIAKLNQLEGFVWTVKNYQGKKRAREALSTQPSASEPNINASETVRGDSGSSAPPSEPLKSQQRRKRQRRTTPTANNETPNTTSPGQLRETSARAQSSDSDSESDIDDEDQEEDRQVPLRRRGPPFAPSPAPSPANVDAADASSPNNGASGQEGCLSGTDKSNTSATSSNNEEEEAPGSRQNLPNQSSDEDESSTNDQNDPHTDAEDDDGQENPEFPMNYDEDDDTSPEQNGGSQQHQGQLMQSDSQQDETGSVAIMERMVGAGGSDGNEEGTGAVALLTNCMAILLETQCRRMMKGDLLVTS